MTYTVVMEADPHTTIHRANAVRGCVCGRCATIRARKLLSWRKNREKNAEKIAYRRARWYARNGAAWAREYRRKDPERAKAAARRSYARNGRVLAAAWRLKNPDAVAAIKQRFSERHPHYNTLCQWAWIAANPVKYEAKRARDRARLATSRRNRRDTYAERVARVRVSAVAGTACHICGMETYLGHPDRRLRPSIDHVIPVSLGGKTEPDNIKIAHLLCNQIKHARRDVPDFIVGHARERIRALVFM